MGAAELVLGEEILPGVLAKAAIALFVMTLLSVSFPEPLRSEGEPRVYETEPIVVTGGRTVSDPGRSNRSVATVTGKGSSPFPSTALPASWNTSPVSTSGDGGLSASRPTSAYGVHPSSRPWSSSTASR